MKTVGKSKDHLRLVLVDSNNDHDRRGRAPIIVDAIAFQFGWLEGQCKPGDCIDILYAYEVNTFNGRQSIQLNVRDLQLKSTN